MAVINKLDVIEIECKTAVIRISSLYPFSIHVVTNRSTALNGNLHFKIKEIKNINENDFMGKIKSYSNSYNRVILFAERNLDHCSVATVFEKISITIRKSSNLFKVQEDAYTEWCRAYIDSSYRPAKLSVNSMHKISDNRYNLLQPATNIPKLGIHSLIENNLYCFLDCEYFGYKIQNKHVVREIAVTYCIKEDNQMRVVSKYFNSDDNTFKLCKEFVDYSDQFAKELLEYYDLHKAVYIGHGVADDLDCIYNTAHTKTPKYTTINTATIDWVPCWTKNAAHFVKGKQSIKDLVNAYMLTTSEISEKVEEFYGISSSTFHDAAFDSIALILILNISLLGEYDHDQWANYYKVKGNRRA